MNPARALRRAAARSALAALALAGASLVAAPVLAAPSAPKWADLKPVEREVLAPLKEDWEQLDAQRKRKWLAVVKRYPTMKPDEQARLTERMRSWASLTPEQRRAAREMFLRQAQMPSEKRDALPRKWEEYQQAGKAERSGQAAEGGAIVPTAVKE